MDPVLPRIEEEHRRRRKRLLFRQRRIPVRLLVPNVFTVLSLCAGLTGIRMAIELKYEMAIALIVVAALLDGVDGRLARLLKAQSKFGAELDSLADFVNFGVAPALVVFMWGLVPLRGGGWIAALVFALATGLRLARFNAMLEVEKPKWQSNYFTGMPAPAGAIVVLLPLYIDGIGLFDARNMPLLVLLYTLAMAALLVSTIPTFSGKLLGERISRDYVMPIFVGVAAMVALLVTYPYETLALATLAYLALIPVGYRRYQEKMRDDQPVPQADAPIEVPTVQMSTEIPAGETKH